MATVSRDELNKEVIERKMAEEELRKLKDILEIKVAEKIKDLKDRVSELECYQDATTDRGLRMKELRDKIEGLGKRLGDKS